MRFAKSLLLFFFSVVLLFMLSGCFQVLHILTLNADKSISVRWRLSLPRAFTEPKPGQPADEQSPRQKMDAAKGDIEKQIGKSVSDFKAAVTDTDTDSIFDISFKTKEYLNVKTEESFVLMPAYSPATRQLTFHFKGNDKKAPPKPESSPKPSAADGEEPAPSAESGDGMQGMEQIAKMIASSARYQIILAGEYVPTRAHIQLPGNVKKELPILSVGNVFLLDFPFMAYADTGKDGFDVVISLK